MELTRRELLAVGTAALAGTEARAAGATRGTSAAGDGLPVPVPPEIKREIAKAYARFRVWKGDDATVVFPLISDVHDENEPVIKPPATPLERWWQKLHVLYANFAARRFGADFVADLGDIGMDRWTKGGLPDWETHMKPRLELERRLYAGLDMPVLFACGNHDLGHANKRISSKEWAALLNVPQQRAGRGATALGPHGDYGYLDLPSKRTRVLLLDTSVDAPGGSRISPDETAWAARTLDATPDGWRLVVLSHICLDPQLGVWTIEAGVRNDPPGFREMRTALERFAAARRTQVLTFSGHSHCDCERERNGVVYAITQSLGTAPFRAVPADGRYRQVNRACETLVDFVALKPASGDCRVFRVGVGGEAADRDLSGNANRGAVAAVFRDGALHLTVPGVAGRTAFAVAAGDARRKNMTAETRDGIRFVWIDNVGGEVNRAQFDFFNRERQAREPLAVVLAVPLYMPGLSVAEAPCGHPGWRMPPDHPEAAVRTGWLGGGHSHITCHFRWNVLHAPRLAGIFSAFGDASFSAVCDSAFQVVGPAGSGLAVSVNGAS